MNTQVSIDQLCGISCEELPPELGLASHNSFILVYEHHWLMHDQIYNLCTSDSRFLVSSQEQLYALECLFKDIYINCYLFYVKNKKSFKEIIDGWNTLLNHHPQTNIFLKDIADVKKILGHDIKKMIDILLGCLRLEDNTRDALIVVKHNIHSGSFVSDRYDIDAFVDITSLRKRIDTIAKMHTELMKEFSKYIVQRKES